MKRLVLVILFLLIATPAFCAFPSGWGRKCALTIDKTKVAADQSNFPVLFTEENLPSECLDGGANSALDGGGDVRFSSDSAGATQLPCEVVSFVTGGSPAAEVWVKANISSTTSTVVYVWYKKAGETQPARNDTYGSDNVWDSNYQAVYHMDGANATAIDDSTSNQYDATADAGTVDYNQTGMFSSSKSIQCNAANEYLEYDNYANLNFTDNFTIEASYKSNVTTGQIQGIFCKYAGVATAGWLLWKTGDNNKFCFYTQQPTGDCRETTATADTNWHRIVGVCNAGTHNIYIDGGVTGNTVSEVTVSTSVVKSRNGVLYGDQAPYGSNGYIGECRASSTPRSATWITTDYNNQSSPSTFASAGTPESVSSFKPLVIYITS